MIQTPKRQAQRPPGTPWYTATNPEGSTFTGFGDNAVKPAKIIATAREKGLIILRCGVHHNVIRTLMPLTIPDELLEEGLDMLGASLGA